MRGRFAIGHSLSTYPISHEYCQHIADLIGADQKDIIFTSGATETNNMAIKGVARFHKDKKRHVITTQTVGLVLFVLVTALLTTYRSTNVYSIRVESYRRRVLM